MLDMAPTAPRRASPSLDEAIAQLATRQYGVISRNQLRALGLTDGGIAARIRRGTLHRRHQGVYAVGHTVVVERGRWMAAVLACGDNAGLSHAAAGALRGLRESDGSVVDVTVPGSGGRRRKQRIRVHRARSLDGQTTVKDRIPVTTPGRTILDLAARLDRRGIERLLDRAEHARLGDELPLASRSNQTAAATPSTPP